jgi:hypothetical protein
VIARYSPTEWRAPLPSFTVGARRAVPARYRYPSHTRGVLHTPAASASPHHVAAYCIRPPNRHPGPYRRLYAY